MQELEIIRHARVEGISLFFDTVEYRTPHFHPEWELIWITQGELTVGCGRREEICRAGELCLFHPNRLHEFRRCGESATFLCLQIAPQILAPVYPSLPSLAIEPFRITPLLSCDSRAAVQTALKSLMALYLSGAPYYELRCLALCAELLGNLLRELPVERLSEEALAHADRRNARLARFISYVDENYMRKLSLSEFARQEGCTVSYLSRFLKSNLNQSFQDYVTSVRYHSACRLIAEGGKRLLDICEEAGFSDYRYFSACFKKQCGLTPEEYRRRSPVSDALPVRRSLHSQERFYTLEESKALLCGL